MVWQDNSLGVKTLPRTASRCFVLRDGDLGLFWRASCSRGGVVGLVPKKRTYDGTPKPGLTVAFNRLSVTADNPVNEVIGLVLRHKPLLHQEVVELDLQSQLTYND